MHGQRVSIFIAAAAGMLGTFLPWVNVPIFGSITGTGIKGEDWFNGWITFALFGAALLLALVGNKQRVLRIWQFLGVVLLSGTAGGIGLVKIIDLHRPIGGAGSDSSLSMSVSSIVSVGVGLYLIVGAGVAVILLGFLLRKE